MGNGEIAHYEQFLLFPVFSIHFEKFLPFSLHLKLSCAICLNLEGFEICGLGKGILIRKSQNFRQVKIESI